jgi:hypothetical protein
MTGAPGGCDLAAGLTVVGYGADCHSDRTHLVVHVVYRQGQVADGSFYAALDRIGTWDAVTWAGDGRGGDQVEVTGESADVIVHRIREAADPVERVDTGGRYL